MTSDVDDSNVPEAAVVSSRSRLRSIGGSSTCRALLLLGRGACPPAELARLARLSCSSCSRSRSERRSRSARMRDSSASQDGLCRDEDAAVAWRGVSGAAARRAARSRRRAAMRDETEADATPAAAATVEAADAVEAMAAAAAAAAAVAAAVDGVTPTLEANAAYSACSLDDEPVGAASVPSAAAVARRTSVSGTATATATGTVGAACLSGTAPLPGPPRRALARLPRADGGIQSEERRQHCWTSSCYSVWCFLSSHSAQTQNNMHMQNRDAHTHTQHAHALQSIHHAVVPVRVLSLAIAGQAPRHLATQFGPCWS